MNLAVTISHHLLGSYNFFMQKEIFEQPESVTNTMRGRLRFDDFHGMCESLATLASV